jgi:hypothetical protein
MDPARLHRARWTDPDGGHHRRVQAGPSAAIREALVALDEEDLVQVRDGQVDIAYPFSATPTPFVVWLADWQKRYGCCAIDALGIAPMLGHRVHIQSQ